MSKPIFKMIVNGHTGHDDDGVWFEGTLAQFDDCFFTGLNPEKVLWFAKSEGSYILGKIE